MSSSREEGQEDDRRDHMATKAEEGRGSLTAPLSCLPELVLRICRPLKGSSSAPKPSEKPQRVVVPNIASPKLPPREASNEINTATPRSADESAESVDQCDAPADDGALSPPRVSRQGSAACSPHRPGEHFMEKATLNEVAARHVWNRDREHELGKSCEVCCGEYVKGDRLRVLPCKHTFHRECVDGMLLKKGCCPACRKNVLRRFGPLRALARASRRRSPVKKMNALVRMLLLQRKKCNAVMQRKTLYNKVLGAAVERGRDWKWARQDGPHGQKLVGITVPGCEEEGWVRVLWKNGQSNNYRVGAEGCYDLRRPSV